MAVEYKAWDDQVIFYTQFQTLESMIVAEAIEKAVPESAKYTPGSLLFQGFSTFRMCLSNTQRIVFKLNKDADHDLVAFKAFWTKAQNNADYAALWPEFRTLYKDVLETWQVAIAESLPARLLAPLDVRPDALGDEELAALDPNA